MSHQIFGKRFLSTREPAWHGIGLSWTGPKSASDAVTESQAAEVIMQTRRMGWERPDGVFEPLDDRAVIVRLPVLDDPVTRRVGEASADYTILQNAEIAAALDASGVTTRWPVETCGVLGKGEVLFICLDMGADQIAGEEHRRYALITDKRDGASALQLLTTYTRVVCQNTLQIALGNGETRVSLAHTGTIGADWRFSLDVMEQVEKTSAQTKSALAALHTLRVRAEDVRSVLDHTYAPPRKGTLLRQYERVDDPAQFDPATLARLEQLQERHAYDRSQRATLRQAAEERYDVLCQEYPRLAGTGLGVLNAVAEIADHTRNGRASGSAILGMRADEKIRCYKALCDLR